MNYVQIEIGGKVRGLKFNQLAMQELSLNYQRHNKLAESSPELFFIYNVFYSGLVGNCIVKNEEPDFTFFDVVDWVDELYEAGKDDERGKVIEAFSNTRAWKETIERVSDKLEEKKSKPAKKSKSIGTNA